MQYAITHAVSPLIGECELTFLERKPIDIDLARRQHEAYCSTLERLGVPVKRLDGNIGFPDSVFVEDTAVVTDEIAVICCPGAPSRRGEVDIIQSELANHRETVRITLSATIDGGDVLCVGKRVFVGLSRRTNQGGANELQHILAPFGYEVTPVVTNGSLHLKSACTAVDDETLIVNKEWIDAEQLAGFRLIQTAIGEDHSANVLRVGDTVCVQAGFPRAAEAVEKMGIAIEIIDTSELMKAEAALTCSSIIFNVEN